jgi:hypothetical protein
LSDDGVIRRALESIRGKRRISFSVSEDEYALRELQLGDEIEDMGCEVLKALKDLNGEALENFGLYTSADYGNITVYKRCFSRDIYQFREEYRVGERGLTYELTGPDDGAHMFKDLLNRGEIMLGSPSDFRQLNNDSIRNLHADVTSEDFVERLAWRYGRQGKPGYTAEGFEEEQQTWKVANEDPPKRPSSRAQVEK